MQDKTFEFGEAEIARLHELWVPGVNARDLAQTLSDEFGGVLTQQHFEEMLAQEGLLSIEENARPGAAPSTPPTGSDGAPPAGAKKPGKAPETPPAPVVPAPAASTDGAAQ